MVKLDNKHTLSITIIAGHRAWAFPSKYDLWLYLEGYARKDLPKCDKINVVFTETKRVTMYYEELPQPVGKPFAYSILDEPINHPKYGRVAAWGFWVHN